MVAPNPAALFKPATGLGWLGPCVATWRWPNFHLRILPPWVLERYRRCRQESSPVRASL